jgi:hypothetical protein
MKRASITVDQLLEQVLRDDDALDLVGLFVDLRGQRSLSTSYRRPVIVRTYVHQVHREMSDSSQ